MEKQTLILDNLHTPSARSLQKRISIEWAPNHCSEHQMTFVSFNNLCVAGHVCCAEQNTNKTLNLILILSAYIHYPMCIQLLLLQLLSNPAGISTKALPHNLCFHYNYHVFPANSFTNVISCILTKRNVLLGASTISSEATATYSNHLLLVCQPFIL